MTEVKSAAIRVTCLLELADPLGLRFDHLRRGGEGGGYWQGVLCIAGHFPSVVLTHLEEAFSAAAQQLKMLHDPALRGHEGGPASSPVHNAHKQGCG
jgi:hypothetical protein